MTIDIAGLRAEIEQWARAYPLDIFPEPDLEHAALALGNHGLTLDAISASNMRHVVSKIAPHVHSLLDEIERLNGERERLSLDDIVSHAFTAGTDWQKYGGGSFEDAAKKCLKQVRQALQSGEAK